MDGYWNSREQSFAQHLFRLMTSWAVVADIWFLDQQTLRPGEKPEDFARRVQRLIAARAGLKAVDWDGYMKYWKPNARFIERQQRLVAEQLCGELGIPFATAAAPPGGLPGAHSVVDSAKTAPAPGGHRQEGEEDGVAQQLRQGDGSEAHNANGAAGSSPRSAAVAGVSPRPPVHPSSGPRGGSGTPPTVVGRAGSSRSSVAGGAGSATPGSQRAGAAGLGPSPSSASRRGGSSGAGVGGSSSSGVFTRGRTGTHGTVTSLLSAASTTPRIRNTQPLVGEGLASFPDGDALAYHRDRRPSAADPDGGGDTEYEEGSGSEDASPPMPASSSVRRGGVESVAGRAGSSGSRDFTASQRGSRDDGIARAAVRATVDAPAAAAVGLGSDDGSDAYPSATASSSSSSSPSLAPQSQSAGDAFAARLSPTGYVHTAPAGLGAVPELANGTGGTGHVGGEDHQADPEALHSGVDAGAALEAGEATDGPASPSGGVRRRGRPMRA